MNVTIGFDLGGTTMLSALVDTNGNVLYQKEDATLVEQGRENVMGRILTLLGDTLAHARTSNWQVNGIGMGIAGLIDYRNGMVHTSPNFPDWQNVPLGSQIQTHFNLPVTMDNDVRVAALAEMAYGAGKGSQNLVCLTVGTGVGSGLILNGQLYRGSTLTAGELGHMIVVPHGGKPCGCGGRGCLETVIGVQPIIEMAHQYIQKQSFPILEDALRKSGGILSPAIVAQAAQAGDPASLDIWQKVGEWLGMALSNIVNLLNPEKIIIGGGISQAGDLLLTPVRNTIQLRAFSLPATHVQIIPAQLGTQAGIIGAAVLHQTQNQASIEV